MDYLIILAVLALAVVIYFRSRKPAGEATDLTAAADEPAAPAQNFAATGSEAGDAAGLAVTAGISPAKVAAITAAISLLTGKKTGEFVCTAIRPQGQMQGFSAWAMLGTSEIMSTRQRYFERKGN